MLKPYYQDDWATIFHGDALTTLLEIPNESINCCVTSPPYWGLRDYGCDRQIGLEETLTEYVDRIIEVFREVSRILRNDGTLWLNMGDAYTSGNRPDRDPTMVSKTSGLVNRSSGMSRAKTPSGLKPKDLIGLPWRIAFALQSDGWYLRSDIIWNKPNIMPESVTDRPTKTHEYIFLLSKSPLYYYDQESIKERASENTHSRGSGVNPKAAKIPAGWDVSNGRHDGIPKGHYPRPKQNASFSAAVKNVVEYRNKRSVWTVPTQGFSGAHFATFPEDLITPCILAGCPAGGTVLDPFAGSMTTAAVAKNHNRRSISIELNEDYIKLGQKRLAQEVFDFTP